MLTTSAVRGRTGLRPVLALVGVVATVSAAQAGAGRPATQGVYRVGQGETLSAVAARLGVSVSALAEANAITDVHRVRAGARLVVPGAPRGRGARGTTATSARGAVPAKGPGAPGRLPARLRRAPERLALVPAFEAAAREFAVPADLLKALAWQESGWQNNKVSRTRAIGIGQLMPDTIAFLNDVLLPARLNPHRAESNIRMSARFLSYLLSETRGDVAASVAAYYQGLASVRRSGPIPETRRYVADVLALRSKF